MKILIATDSFKGSLTTMQAANAMKTGLLRVFPQALVECIPIADGGEGTAQAMADGLQGKMVSAPVKGPLGDIVNAEYALLPDGSAVIEMAAASGLPLISDRLNVLAADTYGTGQLIKCALDAGAKRIYVGLGGSATNDGGAGCLRALGARLLDHGGGEITPGGGGLSSLASIELFTLDARLAQTEIIIMSDVDSPLCGPKGASAVFGPQKGADQDQVALLDRNLAHYADLLETACKKNIRHMPGAGAAGGLGFGLLALGATIQPGIDVVLNAVDFNRMLDGADLVLTGEGRIDGQSAQGKAPVGVARRSATKGVPVMAIGGSIGVGVDAVYDAGIAAVFAAVCRPMPLREAIENADPLVADAAERAGRTFLALTRTPAK